VFAGPRLQGVHRLVQARELVESEMASTHDRMLHGLNVPYTTGEAFLGDLSTLLCREVPFCKERPVAFLLDDFSVHRLPEAVQVVLNRVIWERRPSHVFKLSCEKRGAILSDSFHATADVTREMIEVDCGREYVGLDDVQQGKKALAFATELLDVRLRAASYQGTIVAPKVKTIFCPQ
jgi:hypothetical protein